MGGASKTDTAEAEAAEMKVPLETIRYDDTMNEDYEVPPELSEEDEAVINGEG